MSNINFNSPFWNNKLVLLDSRKLVFPNQTIFFALKGQFTDGHYYIEQLYQQGVRSFVTSQAIAKEKYPQATILEVNSVIQVLQDYAQCHRAKFDLPLIALTGSNGKTVLKEWLFQLLEQDYSIIKSPKSYNSQIGVPLSVLGMNSKHDLAIFEAGISQVGEMQQLQQILQPTIGIFTNIGEAHASGFKHLQQKIQEKLILFKDCPVLIYSINHKTIHEEITACAASQELWSWGASPQAKIPIYTQVRVQKTWAQIHWNNQVFRLALPFTHTAAIENCLHGIVVLLYLGIAIQDIEQRLQKLQNIPMRLEFKEGINNCYLIDDSYNNDLEGLKIALDFLQQKHKNSPAYSKTLILSDIPEIRSPEGYHLIAQLLEEHQIEKFIGIGPALQEQQQLFKQLTTSYFFNNTSAFINAIGDVSFHQESILLKGARTFEFERIAQQLKKRIHGTVLEINLGAVTHNLQIYRNHLSPNTKIMVMVKASAYGSGSYEIAQLLQYHHVDYLGVAYVDEGVALRERGIQLPIMVMNTALHEFEMLHKHDLEPAIYSFSMLEQFYQFVQQKNNNKAYPIHLELDTGMHRLGFMPQEIEQLIPILKKTTAVLQIKGIFSHLAASDETEQQPFSHLQIHRFKTIAQQIEQSLHIKSIQHILNSAGITRFPEHQLDLVRLGIGLYGIDPNGLFPNLQNVVCLKTCIAQIKELSPEETIGYGRKGTLHQASRIAILSIGYADGFLRAFGNGNAYVKVHEQYAPTIGNVCMDMCFIDVSHIPQAQEGDEVIIFDNLASILALARTLQTIPYEVLTNISNRVPRLFYEA